MDTAALGFMSGGVERGSRRGQGLGQARALPLPQISPLRAALTLTRIRGDPWRGAWTPSISEARRAWGSIPRQEGGDRG